MKEFFEIPTVSRESKLDSITKQIYEPPVPEITQKELIDSLKVLTTLREDLKKKSSVEIELNGEKKIIGQCIGFGKSKNVYDIGDGKVILIPNAACHYKKLNLESVESWHQTTVDESSMAAHLRMLGLKALEYQPATIKYKGKTSVVLSAPSFVALERLGMEIIDRRWGRQGEVTSMLFGTVENLKSQLYLRLLLKDIVQDIAVLIANRLVFCTIDSYNFVIERVKNLSEKTSNSEIFSPEKQKVRFFFYDLSGAYASTKFTFANEIDTTMLINDETIVGDIEFCLKHVRINLCNAITRYEMKSFKDSGITDASTVIINNLEKMKPWLIELITMLVRGNLNYSEKEDINGQKEVNQFLATSYEFKKMKEIATANPNNKKYANCVDWIGKCSTLSEIMHRTADLGSETTDKIITYNLGRYNVNPALYVIGFFSNDANFTYYTLHLRENIQAYLNTNREENNKHFPS